MPALTLFVLLILFAARSALTKLDEAAEELFEITDNSDLSRLIYHSMRATREALTCWTGFNTNKLRTFQKASIQGHLEESTTILSKIPSSFSSNILKDDMDIALGQNSDQSGPGKFERGQKVRQGAEYAYVENVNPKGGNKRELKTLFKLENIVAASSDVEGAGAAAAQIRLKLESGKVVYFRLASKLRMRIWLHFFQICVERNQAKKNLQLLPCWQRFQFLSSHCFAQITPTADLSGDFCFSFAPRSVIELEKARGQCDVPQKLEFMSKKRKGSISMSINALQKTKVSRLDLATSAASSVSVKNLLPTDFLSGIIPARPLLERGKEGSHSSQTWVTSHYAVLTIGTKTGKMKKIEALTASSAEVEVEIDMSMPRRMRLRGTRGSSKRAVGSLFTVLFGELSMEDVVSYRQGFGVKGLRLYLYVVCRTGKLELKLDFINPLSLGYFMDALSIFLQPPPSSFLRLQHELPIRLPLV